MKDFGNVDSKYRFVIIASKRAKELLKGAKARVKTKSKNPIRIAQNEVKLGLVDFEILPTKKEEVVEPEERVFLGEQAAGIFEEEHEAEGGAAEKEGAAAAEDVGVDFTEEFESAEGGEDEEKEGGEEEEEPGEDEEA